VAIEEERAAAKWREPATSSDELRAYLAKLTPGATVTTVIVAANVLVFAVMAVAGVSLLHPLPASLLKWGGNYGPATLHGEPWRLATSMFVHGGLLHLAMNTWVFWYVGRLVERLLGPLAFSAAYLLAGLAGSIASLAVHPATVSVGASGAIFGLFGVLAGRGGSRWART
jgi:rhomboid protease GluP